ncbi:MAG TPA: hypothetical protein VL970_07485 [Candidatus Acidoferrales bacterium]|nr:hypothetical protein [Candidatus Acidoferrales bacterium]
MIFERPTDDHSEPLAGAQEMAAPVTPGAELHPICRGRAGDLYLADVTNGVPYKFRRRM